MKRLAIIDLGTNTFNILIAETTSDNKFKILLSEKRPVKLGEGRINEGEIIPAAINRGIQAIHSYTELLRKYQVNQTRAFGTSALRTATNGNVLLELIKVETGIDVEIVSGNREAELIYLGVRQTLLLNNHKFLILDIGGGSNEFILADMDRIYWKKSYPLGIARLLVKFKPSDPITQSEVNSITGYLLQELKDLFEIMREEKVNTLVGASGSFETFVHMIAESEVVETEGQTEAISNHIPIEHFNALHQKLIKSSVADRKVMKGLEPMRIEMIVLASLFVKTLFENHPFETLYQSNFALKEGAVFEMINNEQ
jgi:exopolyphosphatase/guanosine-5'-triphosphate,3'-diphosphate pyrophosphatase